MVVALGLASGTPAEGRRVARRVRVDMGHTELEVDLPSVAVLVAPAPLPLPAALPASAIRLPNATVVHRREAVVASCRPVERAVVSACSRAPPLLG